MVAWYKHNSGAKPSCPLSWSLSVVLPRSRRGKGLALLDVKMVIPIYNKHPWQTGATLLARAMAGL